MSIRLHRIIFTSIVNKEDVKELLDKLGKLDKDKWKIRKENFDLIINQYQKNDNKIFSTIICEIQNEEQDIISIRFNSNNNYY